jgi:ATP-binding cassette subfamily B protein
VTGTDQRDDALGKAYDARLARRLWRYVRPYRTLVAVTVALVFLSGAAQLVQPWIVKKAIDGFILEGRAVGLIVPSLMFLLALVAEFALGWFQLYTLERTGQNTVFDLRMDIFRHLQRLPAAFFDRNPVGRLMTRVTTDVEAINEAFTSGVVLILADLVKLAAIVAVLLWMDWRLALVTFAVLPPMLVLSWFFRVRVREAYRAVRGAIARVNAFIQESVTGMRVLQSYGCESRNLDAFDGLNREHRDAQLQGVFYESAFSAIAELMASATLAAIVWAGGGRFLEGAVTFGTLVAFIEYSGRFFRPVQELTQRYTIMQAAMAASERIFHLLDTPATIVSPADPVRATRPKGAIAFENVTFSYDRESPVLRDVSFRIAPGERVAVVGWTGSGKSTLIRLLSRLYDVNEGRITLDGEDVRNYDLKELRRSVGVVLQDHFLFADSVQANLTLGDPRVTREDVRRAARAVRADRFIERLPRGYDEPVLERGANFSSGEKQLLSFARALAFDPAVLVLDEATSSVDPETERTVQGALETLMRGRTSITIAHRLSTVRHSDRILVLHHGRVVEEGTHPELLAVPDGIYRALWALQVAPVRG